MDALEFIQVKNKLRVSHFPQVPCKAFSFEVEDEREAAKIVHVIAKQHLWLYENNFIPDYSNAILVEMWDEDLDNNGKPYGWSSYWNEEMQMEWEGVEELFSSSKNNEQ